MSLLRIVLLILSNRYFTIDDICYSRNKNENVIDIMIKKGAHFLPDDFEVLRELCIAASNNDIQSLRLWKKAKVDLNMSDVDGRTPLHFVSQTSALILAN